MRWTLGANPELSILERVDRYCDCMFCGAQGRNIQTDPNTSAYVKDPPRVIQLFLLQFVCILQLQRCQPLEN